MSLTSPPRTVLDCAAVIQDAYEVEALIAEAQFRRLANKDELKDQLARNAGKRGIAIVRKVLDLPGGPRRTRSKGERAFLRLLREEKIDGYETNSKAFGPELDFVWAYVAVRCRGGRLGRSLRKRRVRAGSTKDRRTSSTRHRSDASNGTSDRRGPHWRSHAPARRFGASKSPAMKSSGRLRAAMSGTTLPSIRKLRGFGDCDEGFGSGLVALGLFLGG